MDAKKAGFNGKTKLNQIRVGSKEDVGVLITPRNDNMLLWLNEELYFQNDDGKLFLLDFIQIPIKKKVIE